MRLILVLFFGLITSQNFLAQVNIMGKQGFINTPSAIWLEERPISFSMANLPGEYSQFKNELTDVYFYNARASLTSFFEINLTIAHRPERAKNNTLGIGDRHLDFRFCLIKERKYFPALVLGLTPPGSAAPFLSHDYLVITKTINSGIGMFTLSTGYGSPYVLIKNENSSAFLDFNLVKKSNTNLKADYLAGIFAGLSYEPFSYGGVMLEYDSNTINGGAYLKPRKWLNLQAYTYEGKEWGFSAALNLSLNFSPKSLRDYAKDLD
jgi:hypothetical protein